MTLTRNQSIVTCIWTAGKAIGTFKQLCTSVDICGDVTSGVNVYRTYYPVHGWPCNVTGVTTETQVTDGNSFFIDLVTGERTEIPADSPLKSLPYPAYFGDVVEIGDYIYYMDTNYYINKVNKNTLELVATGSSGFSMEFTLFKIGDSLFVCYTYNEYLYLVDKDTLSTNRTTFSQYIANIPEYLKSSGRISNIRIHNVGDNFIVYDNVKKFGLGCSNLADIAGSVVPELCQFNIPDYSSFRLLTDTVACLSSYNVGMTNDLNPSTSNGLHVSMDNGQIFSVAEWSDGGFVNTGNKEIRLTIAE